VAAFVDIVAGRVCQPAGGWVHYGLTSSDVVDTALSLALSRAATLLVDAASALEEAIAARARELRDVPMVGRTHGIHAEPTTMGAKLALWALQMRRDRVRLERARQAVSVGKLSGAVGTYSNVDPAVERYVCRRLGLRPVPATQVLARDRHAEFAYACASVAAGVEAFALEVRHLQRTEVGEAAEPFRKGAQKGSSAMPHKRNPVRCEQMCGLARVVRANLVPALENVALWHERDISHSSVERVILPDTSMLTYYLLVKFKEIVEGLEVFPERMLENLERSYGLVFSQPVLLALVASGLDRDAAYRIVHGSAMAAWEERRPFAEILRENPDVTGRLPEERLAACFDLKAALANAGRVFEVLAMDQDDGPEPHPVD
jgi:adenylosuccinate lyase